MIELCTTTSFIFHIQLQTMIYENVKVQSCPSQKRLRNRDNTSYWNHIGNGSKNTKMPCQWERLGNKCGDGIKTFLSKQKCHVIKKSYIFPQNLKRDQGFETLAKSLLFIVVCCRCSSLFVVAISLVLPLAVTLLHSLPCCFEDSSSSIL